MAVFQILGMIPHSREPDFRKFSGPSFLTSRFLMRDVRSSYVWPCWVDMTRSFWEVKMACNVLLLGREAAAVLRKKRCLRMRTNAMLVARDIGEKIFFE